MVGKNLKSIIYQLFYKVIALVFMLLVFITTTERSLLAINIVKTRLTIR